MRRDIKHRWSLCVFVVAWKSAEALKLQFFAVRFVGIAEMHASKLMSLRQVLLKPKHVERVVSCCAFKAYS